MAVYFEAMSGPYQGETFLAKEGFEMGRTQGEILLRNDAKVSSSHAVVKKDKRGNLVLVDLESANGIKVHGQKVKKVTLLPGMTFEVGRTLFKVIEKEGPADVPEGPKEEPWLQTIRTEIPKLATKNSEGKDEIRAFTPAVELKVLQGIQADQKIVLGYGPREFGADTLDIELQEMNSPPIAFEIIPTAEGAEFRTKYPKIVLFNDEPIASRLVKNGDQIRVGQTLIEIGFVK